MLLLTTVSFVYTNYSILFLLLHSELLIINFFLFSSLTAIFYNINYLIGLSFIFLIFGGMEIALNLLLLAF